MEFLVRGILRTPEIAEEIGTRKATGGKKACGMLLALSLLLGPQALWAEHSGTKSRAVGYAQIAKEVATGAWHTAELGAAALGSSLAWELRDENAWPATCLYAILVGGLAKNGLTGFKKLYKKNYDKTASVSIIHDQHEESRTKKRAFAAWHTIQVAGGTYIGLDYWRHRALHPIRPRDKALTILASVLLVGDGILGFQDLFFKKSGKKEGTCLAKHNQEVAE